MEDTIEDYRNSLADLTQNSKPLINMLTMLAEDNETHAGRIVDAIETHLQQVEPAKKLPTLYLIDSIIKNLPKSTYPGLFSHNIVNIFCNMFEQVDEKTRQAMFKVRQTWNQHFPSRKLYALDVRVNNIDHAWPLSSAPPASTSSIHVNPRFLAQKEESLPLPDVAPVEDNEAEMRRQLIAKKAELLKLQQKRLELELKETEARLHSKKTSNDVFVGVEDSQPKVETQPPQRDPRLHRDPRLALKDPRVVRDPRIRPKPTQSELLPSGESQPALTFFGPVTNQPLNQLGSEVSQPPLLAPAVAPQTHGMLPHPMPTAALPHPMPTAPTLIPDISNQNNQALIKEEPMDHKPVTPKKEVRPKISEVKKERVTPEKSQSSLSTPESNVKKTASPNKDKKRRSDPKKTASESKGRDSKESDTKDAKAPNRLDKNENSTSDRKVGNIRHDKNKRVEESDPRKGIKQEESGRSDPHRVKSKRTRDSEEDLHRKNIDRSSENRDRGKNYDSHRRSKSPHPRNSRERSRSPVKGKGAKREVKSRNKTESKNEGKVDKKADEQKEEQKKEQRPPISSLPRIPKRAGADHDERTKDHDERRLSGNKRDLDERHDFKHGERSNKKPRISQERDLGPVKVTTNMTEDISDLFGNEDQDYRHPDVISPRGQGGWAQYKADHPQDFENRRSSLEDVDHRRNTDTDYRAAPYRRPVGPRSGYPPPPRAGNQSESDIPQELRLENRELILRKMEMRRKSGEITHDELQQVLRNLSEFDNLQEQKRFLLAKPEPPRLEPEIHPRDDRYRPPKEPLLEYHSPRKNRDLPVGRPYEPHDRFRGPLEEDRAVRPSLLGPGPAERNFDVDHRKPPILERVPVNRFAGISEIEGGRSPAEAKGEERPSLLGPGPRNHPDPEWVESNKQESGPRPEIINANVRLNGKKGEDGSLAVGAMLESLRAEATPENSQDGMPDLKAKESLRKLDEPKVDRDRDLRQGPAVDERKVTNENDDKVPKLEPKPLYDPELDDRWMMPGGVRMKDGVCVTFPEGTEEVVIDGKPYPVKLSGPKIYVPYKGEELEIYIESSRRMVFINGTNVYKISDPVKEVAWGPGPHQRASVFYHGSPRNLWIDGIHYNMRIDAPPKIIKFRDRDHTVLIDGRDGMLLIDKKEYGTFGGKPRLVRLDGERVELRFTPPPRNIAIDGEQCQIRLDRKIPFIVMNDVARGIRFNGPLREVVINNITYLIPTDRAVEVCVDGKMHMVALGGPLHELIIDGVWYEFQFNGPPREITVGNRKLFIGLPKPPPDVKILDPIPNQKLKEPDIDKTGDEGGKHSSRDDRNSPAFGQKGPSKKPVSILDLDVKPVNFRGKDGRRGSPFDDRRSPDDGFHEKHHRRRRYSPNRRRRSPDRRRHDRNSPVDHFNNGPPGNVPPGRLGQPLVSQPNQPFNPQFPNQPPFMDGPNPRLPGNPPQFMGGQNPPFQPSYQPGGPGNPQIPGLGMFQGPRPPMQQDEGSQGPHPMFQNQPMAPDLPMMTLPMSVGSQPMGSQHMTGVVPPTQIGQPIYTGIAGLLQPQQPPTLQAEPLNVESLLQKLINAGLINKGGNEENTFDKKEPEGKKEEPPKKEMTPDGKNKKKPVRVKLAKPEKIPDLSEMKLNTLKQQYIGVIQRMYSGIQCTSCGTRFMASQTSLYREHLDWHFRQNQREKKGARILKHRSWFYELNDWLEYEEVGDSEERARTNLFEKQSQEAAAVEKESVLPQGENILHCPAATEEDSADVCVVCGDAFEQFFDEESEEWHLKNALRVDDKTYHPVCYEDAQENTPKEDPGANPMLLQIQKELGYVPPDTVISFPAANVISVSQVDHTPKERETTVETPEDKPEAAPS